MGGQQDGRIGVWWNVRKMQRQKNSTLLEKQTGFTTVMVIHINSYSNGEMGEWVDGKFSWWERMVGK